MIFGAILEILLRFLGTDKAIFFYMPKMDFLCGKSFLPTRFHRKTFLYY